MIDVAFQLLNFFIITLKPQDVYAHLSAYRPSPEHERTPQDNPNPMIKIMVMPNIFVFNDKMISLSDLDDKLARMAASDPDQTILVMCAKKSYHSQLVQLLDKCAKNHLKNVSVISSEGI
jgi:biopolymer transport protein ExbD